jgi:ATP-dependent exoDNAse (exonuclease V) beta subunit
MSAPPDSLARRQALDISRSFIVQAPAGSGKTELLIQRYLCLLAAVEEPEQVVAITFTRKAAAEMRARVLAALRDARSQPVEIEAHRRETLQLAARVLEVDDSLGWNLYMQPQRMRIETLDALNASLAMRLPLLSGGVAGANVLDDAQTIYRAAAVATIESAAQDADLRRHIDRVLTELDYDFERCEVMIATLLAHREQWLPTLVPLDGERALRQLSDVLTALNDAHANALSDAVEPGTIARLEWLAAHAAEHATSSELRAQLVAVASEQTHSKWRAVGALLLTKAGSWRKRLTKAEGFLPEHRELKEELLALIEELEVHGGLQPLLDRLMRLPHPLAAEQDFELLTSARTILLNAAAELRLRFAAGRCVDFAELAIAAQRALGAEDNPSDLLLALDRRIQHILVDEYQDTSGSQIRLLELLTAGWSAGDGRTLFLVGDPMQSIYRFRNADMSLFLRTRLHGIGNVTCEPLLLTANFRSSPAVVSWVNDTFIEVFPAQDDAALGLAGFHASEPVRALHADDGVFEHAIESKEVDDEVAEIVALVGSERERTPRGSIGVLVQSRAHLRGLQTRLQQRGWPVRAVEIDALHSEQFVQDLLTLARALTHLADRPAWLGMLRAPWCGLTWADLEVLVHGLPEANVWDLLRDDDRLALLSADGRARASWLRAVLTDILNRRAEQPFILWLNEAWRALGGPDCLAAPLERTKLAQFFAGLESVLVDETIDDPVELERYFERPQRQPDEPNEAVVEIMTIHRAKGLEFDTVILSGLNRRTRGDETRLLEWLDVGTVESRHATLIAPYRRSGSELVAYIRAIESQRADAERARLLYVATTRARRRLHLIWAITDDKPAPASLLSHLWPRVCDVPRVAADRAPPVAEEFMPILRRYEQPGRAIETVPERPEGEVAPVEFEWVGTAAVHVGVVVHRHLQLIAESGLDGWTAARVEALTPEFERHLELLGVDAQDLPQAVARVRRALIGVLDDPDGRWIVGPHEDARSELTLVDIVDNRLTHLRVDRTFVDGGYRWIVDYKTGTHEGAEQEAFLDAEVERYRSQMEAYARALARQEGPPVRVALYFPLLQAMRVWTAGMRDATAGG